MRGCGSCICSGRCGSCSCSGRCGSSGRCRCSHCRCCYGGGSCRIGFIYKIADIYHKIFR